VSLADPAVLAGLGLFETLAVRCGRPLELGRHLDRLERGAKRLGIALAPREQLSSTAREVCEELSGDHGWMKIVVTGAGRSWMFADSTVPPGEIRPATAILLPWRRGLRDPLLGLKTLNYAPSLLGLSAARDKRADEGLWLNERGHLAEGCTSNLFVVQKGKLHTAGPRDGILPGIVRDIVLDAAARLGIPIRVGKVRLRRLEQASEAFLTSSVQGVRPLIAYRGRPVGSGRPGPLTLTIAAEVDRLREEAQSRECSDAKTGDGPAERGGSPPAPRRHR
jgi:branched-subunit amino acid aminotransferase/4-amino-4-deoxychorismate lyase